MDTKRTTTQILNDLMEIQGVQAVLIVAKDGFLIESIGSSKNVELDALGASLSIVLQGVTRLSTDMEVPIFHAITLESFGTTLMCVPVGDAILAIVAPDSCSLGMIRLKTKRYVPELNALL